MAKAADSSVPWLSMFARCGQFGHFQEQKRHFSLKAWGDGGENLKYKNFALLKSGDTLPCKRQNFMTARSHLSEKSVTLMNFYVSEQYFSCLSFVFIHTQTCNLFFPVVLCLIILQDFIILFQKISKYSYKSNKIISEII